MAGARPAEIGAAFSASTEGEREQGQADDDGGAKHSGMIAEIAAGGDRWRTSHREQLPYSAGIGVAGACGAVAAAEGGSPGPLSARSSSAMVKVSAKLSTSAQAMKTKRNA